MLLSLFLSLVERLPHHSPSFCLSFDFESPIFVAGMQKRTRLFMTHCPKATRRLARDVTCCLSEGCKSARKIQQLEKIVGNVNSGHAQSDPLPRLNLFEFAQRTPHQAHPELRNATTSNRPMSNSSHSSHSSSSWISQSCLCGSLH